MSDVCLNWRDYWISRKDPSLVERKKTHRRLDSKRNETKLPRSISTSRFIPRRASSGDCWLFSVRPIYDERRSFWFQYAPSINPFLSISFMGFGLMIESFKLLQIMLRSREPSSSRPPSSLSSSGSVEEALPSSPCLTRYSESPFQMSSLYSHSISSCYMLQSPSLFMLGFHFSFKGSCFIERSGGSS